MSAVFVLGSLTRITSTQCTRNFSTVSTMSGRNFSLKKVCIKTAYISGVFLAGASGGYFLANQRFDPGKAVDVLNKERPNWRRYLVKGDTTVPLCISPFAMQAVGTVQFVVWNDTNNGQSYILLTCQERTINGETQKFIEPPGGFFNPGIECFGSDKFPPELIEEAEREIEENDRRGIQMSNQKAYEIAKKKFMIKGGKKPYQSDHDLLDTGKRECWEETRFQIKDWLRKSDSEEIISTFTNKKHNATVLHCLVTFDRSTPPPALPALGKYDDEVEHAFWCPFENIDMKNNTVLTSEGQLPIKPTSNILQPFNKVYERYASH